MTAWSGRGLDAWLRAGIPKALAGRGASDDDGGRRRYLSSPKAFVEQSPGGLAGPKAPLRGLLICPNQNLAEDLCAAIEGAGDVSISQIFEIYPTAVELLRAMRMHSPEVVLLSFESMSQARNVVTILESEAPKLPILAVYAFSVPEIMREALRLGARDFLAPPFEKSALQESIANVKTLVTRRSESLDFAPQILSFLPAKAGVGASTVALNVSAAISRPPDARALLADLDLSSGMLRFLLKLRTEHSVADAIEHSHNIEDGLWQLLVTRLDDLDVLPAKHNNPSLRVEDAQIQNLIEFARSRYRVLCFDLSSNLERYSQAVMKESTRVLMVCTPELPSLQMARQKLAFLRTLGIERRVAIVLNRCGETTVTPDQVEQALGYPVIQRLPNDYLGVMDATLSGSRINPRSLLGKSFVELAAKLLDHHAAAPAIDSPAPLKFWELASRALASRVLAWNGSGAKAAVASAEVQGSSTGARQLSAGTSALQHGDSESSRLPALRNAVRSGAAEDDNARKLELRRKSLVNLLASRRSSQNSGTESPGALAPAGVGDRAAKDRGRDTRLTPR